jgi:hypothetical protein
MLSISRHLGGETVAVISSVHGCNQFTPFIGCVAPPKWGSSPVRLMFTFVLGVDVSYWETPTAAPMTDDTIDAALAWTGVLIWDSVIFFLTLHKAFTMGKGIRLLDVIVRDGVWS